MQITTNKRNNFLYPAVLLLLVAGCNITGTEYYSPSFTTVQDSIESRIKTVSDFKQIEFRAARTKNAEGEIIKNGLEIDIVCTLPLPGNNSEFQALARQIAVPVKQALKNPGDYNYYQINFLVNEGINRSLKRQTEKLVVLKSSEL
jgi:hypothetical protein